MDLATALLVLITIVPVAICIAEALHYFVHRAIGKW